jgi:ABC-type transport system involved in Fe-S cluster assembly fused permease/ATPase subunit
MLHFFVREARRTNMERAHNERGLGYLREVIALIWNEADRFVKVRLASSLLLTLIASALTGLGPVALKLVVDRFAGGTNASTTPVAVLIGLYVLSQGFARSVGEFRAFAYGAAEQRMVRTLSERLFTHLLKLPLRFHLNRQTGAVTQILMNGIQGFMHVLHTLMFGTLPVVIELATIVVVLSRLGQPAFLLFFSGAIVCYSVAFVYSSRRTLEASKSGSAAQIEANAAMTDNILNYETIKYFAAEAVVQRTVSEALKRTEAEWVRFSGKFAVNGLYVAAIYTAFLALTVLYAAHETEAGRISLGTFVLMNTYMLQIVRPVEMLGSAAQTLSQGIGNLDKMLSFFREQSEDLTKGNTAPLTGPGALEFSKVGVSYNSDRAILTDVSFQVPAGRTLGIVGHSGSGKSTIVRLVTRLLEPDSGCILLDGTPISGISLTRLRETIAVVPQDTILLNETIARNIAFGKAGSTRNEVEEAARLAHLHDFILSLPEGYETRVGERGVKLSGGEKQRVSIARAVIKRPTLYVFDEATSSLDTRSEREIMKNLREISSHSTTLVIAHRLSTVVYADHIVVLDAGVIVEQGTHESLIAQSGKYAALWLAQHEAKSTVDV